MAAVIQPEKTATDNDIIFDFIHDISLSFYD